MTASRVSLALKMTLLFVVLCGGGVAHAHTGHATRSFFDGFMHPWLGWDHLLAMVAVGLWAVQLGGKRHLWLLPATFAIGVAAGAVHGYLDGPLPAVEPAILVSLFVFGVLLAACVRLPSVAALLLTASFGIFHGHAHGAEIPSAVMVWQYGAGFILATASLHVLGVCGALAAVKWRQAWLLRLTGAGIAASGLALMVA